MVLQPGLPTPHTSLAASTQAADTGRVLIVEDEAELAEVLDFNLRCQGFATLLAQDGLSACRLIGSERPELILLDLMLPDLDGWEICRMVRSHPDPAVARTPIIMLTACGTLEDRVKGLECGADLYLSKPYSVKEVLLHVRQISDRSRRQLLLEAELLRWQDTVEQERGRQQMLFHELRNQLLLITGYSGRLDSRQQQLPPETAREYLQIINHSSHYLSHLAEEFLLVRQLEATGRQLPAEPVQPCWLAEELIRLYRPHAQKLGKKLEFQCQSPLPQQLNATALKLILSSLLDNALKYSGSGVWITVHLASSATGLEIRVADEGPGLAKDDLERIFTKFQRGLQPADQPQGTGLGLYTTRTLAQAMGGTVRAENRPQGGACFIVQIPA